MTNSSVGLNRHLYYAIRSNNSENTLHAWMHHILAYLAAYNEAALNDAQEPHLQQSAGCDGSCDCQSNLWVRELSYEEHYRKVLLNRVNVGDTCRAISVDEESLRREAMLVVESQNQQHADVNEQPDIDDAEPMDVDPSEESAGPIDDWDFVMYESDAESDDSDDLTYKPDGSDLSRMDSTYSSEDSEYEDDDDNLSSYTYNVRMPTTPFNGDAGQCRGRQSDADEYDYLYESADEYDQDCEWDASTMD